MFKKGLLIYLLSGFLLADNPDLGTTYNIVERDMVELIKDKISNNPDMLKKNLEKARQQFKTKMDNLAPTVSRKITPAYTDDTFEADMTYTNKMDIRDYNGAILYPKGFKFNVLTYIKLPYKLVFIDGTRKNELDWIIKNELANSTGFRVLLVKGKYRVVRQYLKHHVFFATDQIVDKFHIRHTPSIAEQIGQKMIIKEFYIKSDKNNTIDESKYPSLLRNIADNNLTVSDKNSSKIKFSDLNLTESLSKIIGEKNEIAK